MLTPPPPCAHCRTDCGKDSVQCPACLAEVHKLCMSEHFRQCPGLAKLTAGSNLARYFPTGLEQLDKLKIRLPEPPREEIRSGPIARDPEAYDPVQERQRRELDRRLQRELYGIEDRQGAPLWTGGVFLLLFVGALGGLAWGVYRLLKWLL